MRKLDIPRSTFHYLVRKGEISKIVLPLRKQAVYSKQEIDKVAEEKARMLTELDAAPERITFVIPNQEDLEQLIEIEKTRYHEETIFSPETIKQRMQFNPENVHVLKDNQTNSVLGSITMSAIKEETLKKLINLEIDDTKVPVEDYLPFTPGTTQDIYIMSIIAKPAVTEKYYAGKLLVAIFNYLTELLDRGVKIGKIYTVAVTKEGEELAKNLEFTPLNTKWSGENEEFRHSYMLDITNLSSKHMLVKMFQRHLKNLERRRKRYEKQSKSK